MPSYSSVGVALDKHKIASNHAYIPLFEIDILDNLGVIVETIRVVNDTKPYTFQGNEYIPMIFNFNLKMEKNTAPEINLTITDIHQIIQARLQEYSGAVDYPVRVMIVSTAAPDNIEIAQKFKVVGVSAKADTYQITFTLGSENPLAMRYPHRLFFRDRCMFVYRGSKCGYSGGLATCDYTLNGENGCKAHNNETRFGGFAGLRT